MDKKPVMAPAMISGLQDPDPLVRRFSIYALERAGHQPSVPLIAPLLKDEDPWVRRTAAVALGKLGVQDAAPALVAALKDKEPYVRFDAFLALGRLGDPSTQKAVLAALGDERLLDLGQGDQQTLIKMLELPSFTDPGVPAFLKGVLEKQREGKVTDLIGTTAAFVLAEKYRDASGEDLLLKQLEGVDYNQQDAAKALGMLKSRKAVPGLVKAFSSEWMNNRRYAVEALGEIGDAEAIPALEALLAHPDYRLRRASADALKKIDGRARTIEPDGPAAAASVIADADLKTPGGKRPPQFIVLGVDDCANIEGLEAMEDICETLRAMGSRAVFTMWVAPLSGSSVNFDLEKKKLLYQRLFDMGCEVAHHTLNHNPGGKFWTSLPKDQQVVQIEGCTKWYQDNIVGFTRPYAHKGGGGGSGTPVDREYSRQLIAAQRFLYSGGRGGHPDTQMWPTPPEAPSVTWRIPTGSLDAAAPPVHAKITDGIVSDYPGRFDYPVPDGVAMWKANFEYHYNHPRRPIIAVNAFHDWGLRDVKDRLTRPTHRTEGSILKAFLVDVLVTNREKYPDAYCVSFSQVLEYTTNGGDLQRTLAVGNGQDSRNPLRPSFLLPDEEWPPKR